MDCRDLYGRSYFISQKIIVDILYILLYNITTNTVEKHSSYNEKDINENIVFIDKNTVYKCFDVISYVFNRMYEEAYLFINYNIFSELILL